MRIIPRLAVAVTALIVTAGTASAGNDAWRGDATNDPNSNFLLHAYPAAANHCPAGHRPIALGGAVYCGTPTAGPYYDRPGARRHAVPKAAHRHTRTPVGATGFFAPVGEKGIARR